ncbi:2-hydroxy-3-keto-5-methylthiopentenyl-1-phosphate phosphatase, partial [candidate division KSB1 bacterium]
MNYSVCCDFDGTISIGDVGNNLFRTFSAIPLEGILNAWKNGKIDSRECLKRECELVTVTEEQLINFADKQKIEPTFKKFYFYCKEKKWNFLILSDGLELY